MCIGSLSLGMTFTRSVLRFMARALSPCLHDSTTQAIPRLFGPHMKTFDFARTGPHAMQRAAANQPARHILRHDQPCLWGERTSCRSCQNDPMSISACSGDPYPLRSTCGQRRSNTPAASDPDRPALQGPRHLWGRNLVVESGGFSEGQHHAHTSPRRACTSFQILVMWLI